MGRKYANENEQAIGPARFDSTPRLKMRPALNPSQLPGTPSGAKAPVQKPRKQLSTCPGSGQHKLRISPANIREYAGSRVTISTDL